MADPEDNSMSNSVTEDSATTEDEASQSSLVHSEAENKSADIPIPSPGPYSNLGIFVSASPPRFITFDQLMAAANGISNMALAHEIVIDNDFKIKKVEPEPNSLHKRVKDIMHKAFWDRLETQLGEDPSDYSQAILLIEEIKEGMLNLLFPRHTRIKAQISEVLDMELIKQKIRNNVFDIYYYADYVISMLAKLCAPIRDEQIAQLREIKEVVPLFRNIFEMLELMKMDLANFNIKQIRPYLQLQSAEYERAKFQEILKTQEENGLDALKMTKAWLKRNYDRLVVEKEVAGSSVDEGATAMDSASLLTPAAILSTSYLELLEWNNTQVFPETLALDTARFMDLKGKVRRMTLVSAMLLVTYNTVGSPITGVQDLKEQLKTCVMTLLEGTSSDRDQSAIIQNCADQVSKTVNIWLKDHGFAELDEEKREMLVGQIQEVGSSPNNPVNKLMFQRTQDFIYQSMSRCQPKPMKIPPGMSVMEKEFCNMCGQFMRLVSHNRSVFGTYYSDIINMLLKGNQNEQVSPKK